LIGFVLRPALIAFAILVDRKSRQARTAASLKIESSCGIVEERYVPIGAIDQWIGIRGENTANPVLLILHGGPGSSYSIFTSHLRVWEKHFTIVQWDQRGAGRTFARAGKRKDSVISLDQLTLDQLAADGAEVAEYLRTRLGKERIFVLASSLGSIFGTRLARRCPDLFYAYIGTDQNVGMGKGQREDFNQLLQRLRTLGFTKELIGPDCTHWTPADYEAIARWTMKSDPPGFQRTMKLLKNAVWYAPGWTLGDIRAFVYGMRYSLKQLLPEITRYDAWNEGTHFELPFFIFQGEADVLTTPERARAYFDDVVARIKHFALIKDAGHFAAFSQPEQFLRQLLPRSTPGRSLPHRRVIPIPYRSVIPTVAGQSAVVLAFAFWGAHPIMN
jgi:pimeloyl-ACP methyl ester carboxylesterase